MYTLVDQPEEFDELVSESKRLAQKLTSIIKPARERIVIPRGTDLILAADSKKLDRIYLLHEGALSYVKDERVLFFYDDGDLIGVDQCFSPSKVRVFSDFAVVVDEYSISSILHATRESIEAQTVWNNVLVNYIRLLTVLLGSLSKSEVITHPEVRNYLPGEIVVKQGDKATEVFTLVEGSLSVNVDGVRVGEIKKDEMFGIIGALSETNRTATVMAEDNCLVLVLPREKFVDLIHRRPGAVYKMVEDLSRTIIDLNKRVVDYKLSKI